MNMLQASVLFTAGGNIHHQLMELVARDKTHENELRELNAIYASANTRENRTKLNDFIVSHREEIYKAFCKTCSFTDSYNLKD